MLLCPDEKLLSAIHIKFAEHVAEVMAHGRGANEESAGNILIGQAFSEQSQHVRFTFGQDFGRVRQDCAAVGVAGRPGSLQWGVPLAVAIPAL